MNAEVTVGTTIESQISNQEEQANDVTVEAMNGKNIAISEIESTLKQPSSNDESERQRIRDFSLIKPQATENLASIDLVNDSQKPESI